MIRHVVLFTASDPDDRRAVADGLALLARIPHAARFEVAENLRSDRYDRSVDVIVYAEFDSEADLEAYRRHPFYDEATRRVRPLRDLRLAADWDAAGLVAAARRGEPDPAAG